MNIHSPSTSAIIEELIRQDLERLQKHEFYQDPFWENLKSTGTELWLDTGDMEEAEKIWTREMTALTTNNTLLNKEIQKGIYDGFIEKVNAGLKGIPLEDRVVEIAFILNARHGLRLVNRFGGKVSVELHTALSFDQEAIVDYGRRFHRIAPDHFIIKVPYTAAGLLGARKLRQEDIPVNFTLEFSARQNALVAMVVKPNYLNVFLGRLNAFITDNRLGSGDFVGEKTTWASQKIVKELTGSNSTPTKQIAASMRNYQQLETLAGIDVFTMPTSVATEGRRNLKGDFSYHGDQDLEVKLSSDAEPDAVKIEKLWEVTDDEKKLALSLDRFTPEDEAELIEAAFDLNCGDMFPKLSEEDHRRIFDDGKIPVYSRWIERIRRGELAIDTLMNLAGLASFTADQMAMDDRIRKLIA